MIRERRTQAMVRMSALTEGLSTPPHRVNDDWLRTVPSRGKDLRGARTATA
jgi:hypothetical protein